MPVTRQQLKKLKQCTKILNKSCKLRQYHFIQLKDLLCLASTPFQPSFAIQCNLIAVVDHVTCINSRRSYFGTFYLSIRLCDPTVPTGLQCKIEADSNRSKLLPPLNHGCVIIVHRASYEGSELHISVSDGSVLYNFPTVDSCNKAHLRLGANVTANDLNTVRQLHIWHEWRSRKSSANTACLSSAKYFVEDEKLIGSHRLMIDYSGKDQICLPNQDLLVEQMQLIPEVDEHRLTGSDEDLLLKISDPVPLCVLSIDELLALAVKTTSESLVTVSLCAARIARIMPATPDLLSWLLCPTCHCTQPICNSSDAVCTKAEPTECRSCQSRSPMLTQMRISLLLSNSIKESSLSASPMQSVSGVLAHAFNASAELLMGTLGCVTDMSRQRRRLHQRLRRSLLGRNVLVRVTHFRNANRVVCFHLDNGIDQFID